MSIDKSAGGSIMRRRSDKEIGATLVGNQLSIVKYGNPILKAIRVEKPRQFKEEDQRNPNSGFPQLPTLPGLNHPRLLARDAIFSEEQFEHCLGMMYSSKEYEENGRVFERTISTEQARRDELWYLEGKLIYKEHNLGVHTRSHSKMKVALALRSLDELIRQETLCCVERGMIIKDIREFFQLYFKIYENMEIRSGQSFRELNSDLESDGNMAAMQEDHIQLSSEMEELNTILEEREKELEELKQAYRRNNDVVVKIRQVEEDNVRKSNLALLPMLETVNPYCKALTDVQNLLDHARMAIAKGLLDSDAQVLNFS